MTFELSQLIRPNIARLVPYRCARDDYVDGVLLDANENSFGPITQNEDSSEVEKNLNRYPNPIYNQRIKQAMGKFRNVQAEQIFMGVGSDEAIDLLFRIFCRPGVDSVLICPPTYGMYKVCANINDVEVQSVSLTPDFQLQIPEILEAVTEKTKIIFVCSPNNPTSNDIDIPSIKTLLDNYQTGIVVVDEAYIDFSNQNSWCSELKNYQNLVVLQTLSKSFGLAGARLGMAFANVEIIETMNKVKAPYNINSLTTEIVLNAVNSIDALNDTVEGLNEQREYLRRELEKIPQIEKIYPSDANFLLVRMPNAQQVYKQLAEDFGIIVRFRGNELHCESCNRISVGTKKENDNLIEKLKIILSKS